MRHFIQAAAAAAMLLLSSCGGNSAQPQPQEAQTNGVYYWRTTLTLDDTERDYLKRHDVGKLYVRYFDVDMEGGYAVPVATLQFIDSIPQGYEVVPVVYITQSAIDDMRLHTSEFAEKILHRVLSISKRYGIEINELQLDCDWTQSTRETFYNLCMAMRQQLGPDRRLSSTIRLHQLTQTPPPVDCGVLMVYNTGNLAAIEANNSIFSKADIEPYLRGDRLKKYSLPIDVAYPVYGWSVVFTPDNKGYRFKSLTRRTDFADYPTIKPTGENTYEVTADTRLSAGEQLTVGDIIRVERPSAAEIIEVKGMIDEQLSGKSYSNIIYHLDQSQLSHYTDDEINQIYR